jgi:hypothetical protein
VLLLKHSVALASCSLECVVVSLIVDQLLLEEVNNVCAYDVQELSGVGYHHNCILADVCDIVLQPHNSIQIEMVSRLIKQEHVRLHE